MIDLVFYLFVFFAIGVFFLFIHLLIGKFIRPYRPDAEKLTIYECGEPTVGSAWIQFDLRYYVVALLFVVFDVEVAFFFPWAIVFGKANELSKPDSALTVDRDRKMLTRELAPANLNLAYLEAGPIQKAPPTQGSPPPQVGQAGSSQGQPVVGDMKKDSQVVQSAGPPQAEVAPIQPQTAAAWAWIAFFDIFLFFGVLMVGFAYLWKRGDIDWVRSTAAESEP